MDQFHLNPVKCHILFGILVGCLIDLDTDYPFCTSHRRQDAQDAGAGAHIYHALALQRQVQNMLHHLRGRVVMPRAESHLWIDHYVIFRLRNFPMECGVDHTSTLDQYWLEIILLPFFVPILSLYHFAGNLEVALHRKVAQRLFGYLDPISRLSLDIGGESGAIRLK